MVKKSYYKQSNFEKLVLHQMMRMLMVVIIVMVNIDVNLVCQAIVDSLDIFTSVTEATYLCLEYTHRLRSIGNIIL